MPSIKSENPIVDFSILERRDDVALSIPIESVITDIDSLVLFLGNSRNILSICTGLGRWELRTDIASARKYAAHFTHEEEYGSEFNPCLAFAIHTPASTRQF